MNSQSYASKNLFEFKEPSGSQPYHEVSRRTKYRSEMDTEVDEIKSFEIGVETVSPLLQSLNDENIELKYQKQFISQEMLIMSETSDYLVKQNQQLIGHYRDRTSDIKKLINTININTNQNYNDLCQQISYYQDANTKIVREIQKLRTKQHLLEEETQQLADLVMGENENRAKSEEIESRLLIQNKSSENKLAEIQSKLLIVKNEKLEKDINNLVVQLHQCRQANLQKLTLLKTKTNDTWILNPEETQQQFKNTVQNLKRLSAQKQQIEEDLSKSKHRLQKLSNASKKIYLKRSEAEANWNKSIYSLNKINESKNGLSQKIKKRLPYLKQLQQNKQHKQYEMHRLETKVANQKIKLHNLKQKHQHDKSGVIDKYNQNISKVRNALNQKLDGHTQQIQSELRKCIRMIAEYKSECMSLQREIQEYEQDIGSQTNPIGELMAYQLNLYKRR